MIISNNCAPSLSEFQNLIDTATLLLNEDAAKRSPYYSNRNAQLLEDDIKRILDITAKGTKFDGTIEKISGQRFPDIIANKYYGVEVKSSKDEKWITLGGSVNESTRVEGIERIFLTFGKLVNPIEFRSRPYEACLSEVVVTHYPRYKIDMNLSDGETIFDKMNTTYDNLRSSDNPAEQVVDFYKSQLKDGESLWWTGKSTREERIEAAPMKIRLWRILTTKEKRELMVAGLSYFPELLSNASTKYGRFSLWLVATHGVVSTSIRDSFSAGGQGAIKTTKETFNKVPRAIINIGKNRDFIVDNILRAHESVLLETWNVNKIDSDRIGQWINCVANTQELKSSGTKEILSAIFNRE